MPALTPDQTEYIYLQWRLLRKANAKAAEFSRKWNEMSEALSQRLDGSGVTDPVLRARTMEQNLELNSYFNAWHFWQREAMRIHAAIHGEYIAMQLLAQHLDSGSPDYLIEAMKK